MMIGVIGGNGVAATNRLCDMIERKTTQAGAFRDAHHPEMIIWQATQAPSRSMYLEGKGPSWIPDYVRIAVELKRIGCNIGCMCCNTAHYAVDEIAEKSGLPFIRLLEEVAKKCKATGERRFELFCSDGARKFDLYGSVFRNIYPDAEIVYPLEAKQRLITKIICDVKTKLRFHSSGLNSPNNLLKDLIASSKLPVILGCTDLRVAFDADEILPQNVAVDSLEVLADSIFALHHPNESTGA